MLLHIKGIKIKEVPESEANTPSKASMEKVVLFK
jgi:hypothetical protein